MSRVLYIGGFCMPDGNAAAQRVLGIAKALKTIGYEIRFSGLKREIDKPERSTAEDFEYINYPYPTSPGQWISYMTGRDSAIAEIKDFGPDIVILYNHPAIAFEHITKYCHKNGIKVLADITEWYEPKGGRLFKAVKGFDVNRRMYKSHLKADGLICISSYLTDFYRNKDIKVIEIPPLVDIEQEKWHQPTNYDPDAIHIVYAGSPGSSKDRLDLVLSTMEDIVSALGRKVKFEVFGITKEQYCKTWRDDQSHDFVIFNGRRPHKEVIKKLLGADFQIFLRPDNLPNKAGFPTKFVETVTSRSLPITNLSSNISKYIIDGKNGFVIKSMGSDSIKNTLEKALSLSRPELDALKMNIDTSLFDYRKYAFKLNEFLMSL